MTEWYWSGSLDAFADMCRLRCKEDTQYESRLVADQISTIMQDLYPVSWAALMSPVLGQWTIRDDPNEQMIGETK